MPNSSQTPAKSPDENKCQHANRHMRLQESAIYERYRAFAATKPNKTVRISAANLAGLFIGVSRSSASRITRNLVAAGWLEVVRGKKWLAEHKSTAIEYRVLSHEEWVLKHPGECPTLTARSHEDAGESEETELADHEVSIGVPPVAIPCATSEHGCAQVSIGVPPVSQSVSPVSNVIIFNPISNHISKPISNPINNLKKTSPQDDRVKSEDLRDFDSREPCQLPAADTLQEQIERMKAGTQDQKTSPPKSPSGGGGAAVAAAPARPAPARPAPARPVQTFIPRSPYDFVDFSGESDLEFDESRLSGFVDHPAIHLPSLKTNEDLLNEAGWDL